MSQTILEVDIIVDNSLKFQETIFSCDDKRR